MKVLHLVVFCAEGGDKDDKKDSSRKDEKHASELCH
jgi:hypothetical protein